MEISFAYPANLTIYTKCFTNSEIKLKLCNVYRH